MCTVIMAQTDEETTFAVGDRFSSYKELDEKVKAYEKSRHVQLTHRDSRTLEASRKRVPKRVESANKVLVYYSVHLTCVFGGKKYVNRGTGERKLQCTLKQGCPMCIKLSLSSDGQQLKVTEVNEDHNHAISKAIYDHLPRQRQLGDSVKREAEDMLRMKVDKTLLQQHLIEKTGKVVTMRDIINIQAGLDTHSDGNNMETLVTRLRAIDGSTVEVFTDDGNAFTGLLFQDKLMKFNFAAYPELLLVDATYKLSELRMLVCLILAIDGNGQSEIVSVFVTAIETETVITKMVQAFKANNPQWSRTKVVMSDKDFVEPAIFRKEFPQASLSICLFHTLQSFKREITCEKLALRPGERDHALEIITKLVYASSAAEYDENYQALLKSGLQTVITYYNTHWHTIHHEWVECFKSAYFTLGEATSNQLESINAEVKSICSRCVSLSTFFDQLFAVLACLRNERDHVTLMALVKKRVTTLPEDSPQFMYAGLLTPYAAGFVSKQLMLREKVVVTDDGGSSCTVSSSQGSISVTLETCQCKFWSAMQLPCRHIFAVREKKQLPLYCSGGIAERWTMANMGEVFDQKNSTMTDNSFQISSTCSQPVKASLSQHQKFRQAQSVAMELPPLAAEVGMLEFEERLSVLKQLRNIWSAGGKAIIHQMDLGQDPQGAGTRKGTGNSKGNGKEHTEQVQQEDHSQEELRVQLPPKMRKRRRPKGAEKTVIGLPRKKKKNDSKPIPEKQPADKERALLLWFVEPHVAEAALAGHIILKGEVEVRPERVQATSLDEMETCRKYFTDDAWNVVQSVVDSRETRAGTSSVEDVPNPSQIKLKPLLPVTTKAVPGVKMWVLPPL